MPANSVMIIRGDISVTAISVAGGVSVKHPVFDGHIRMNEHLLPYVGETQFTPSEEVQVIEIADKHSTSNITIMPIPSNYGRIIWNGTTLRIV